MNTNIGPIEIIVVIIVIDAIVLILEDKATIEITIIIMLSVDVIQVAASVVIDI